MITWKTKRPGPPSVEREMVVMSMLKERKDMLKQLSIARNLSMTQIVESLIKIEVNRISDN